MKWINSRAVAKIRSSTRLIEWTKGKLRTIDRSTLLSSWCWFALHIQGQWRRSNGWPWRFWRDRNRKHEEVCKKQRKTTIWYMPWIEKESRRWKDEGRSVKIRKKSFMDKQWHLEFMRKADEKGSQETWNWLETGTLKKETQRMLMAMQDQALRTNEIKSKVKKQSVSSLHTLCGEREEIICYLAAECKMLT